jgi:hypothetical protein
MPVAIREALLEEVRSFMCYAMRILLQVLICSNLCGLVVAPLLGYPEAVFGGEVSSITCETFPSEATSGGRIGFCEVSNCAKGSLFRDAFGGICASMPVSSPCAIEFSTRSTRSA